MKDRTFARARRRSLGAIFVIPAIIAVVSCAGLISALVGDDLWDWLSWMTLSVPIAVVVWYALRRRRSVKFQSLYGSD